MASFDTEKIIDYWATYRSVDISCHVYVHWESTRLTGRNMCLFVRGCGRNVLFVGLVYGLRLRVVVLHGCVRLLLLLRLFLFCFRLLHGRLRLRVGLLLIRWLLLMLLLLLLRLGVRDMVRNVTLGIRRMSTEMFVVWAYSSCCSCFSVRGCACAYEFFASVASYFWICWNGFVCGGCFGCGYWDYVCCRC